MGEGLECGGLEVGCDRFGAASLGFAEAREGAFGFGRFEPIEEVSEGDASVVGEFGEGFVGGEQVEEEGVGWVAGDGGCGLLCFGLRLDHAREGTDAAGGVEGEWVGCAKAARAGCPYRLI